MAYSPSTTCLINNCNAPSRARGWCVKHYTRWRKTGDPLGVRPPALKGGRQPGFKHSAETIQKIINAKVGKKYNRHVLSFKKPNYSGEKHWNWKGGLSTERKAAMMRAEYRAWRRSVFARDGFTCVACGQHGGSLNADHINNWADYPELRYEVGNGRTLCTACHYQATYNRKMPKNLRWGKDFNLVIQDEF